MKKFIALLLTVVLTASVAIGGTVAYLQYDVSDVNTMTLGNVTIDQLEYERAVGEDGNYETIHAEKRDETGYKLTAFTQAKPLYPATGSVTGWDNTRVCFEQLDGNQLGCMDVLAGLNNVQDKFVFVKNTGKTDAYVRTLIAYEVGSDTDAFGDLIMTSVNVFWDRTDVGVVMIDGNNYFVVEYVYSGANGSNGKHPDGIVHSGEFTYNSLAQVYMASKATNEDVEAIDGNDNGTYDILVLSQAVQAEGFEDAKTALDTAFGETNAVNAAAWFANIEIPTVVTTGDELQDAINNGDSNIILGGDIDLSDGIIIGG